MAAVRTSFLHHNLLITTPSTVHLHSRSSTRPLFKCANASGIVSAKAARDNSALLAIADSHLVILYDTSRAKDKEYILRNHKQGPPRCLLFSPGSKTLIFTTALSNAIQAYSIPTRQLLPPLDPHPSPPKVVAISPDGSILLSASSKPPWILLQDLRTSGGRACPLRPAASEAAVSCATFQERGPQVLPPSLAHFILGFRDGTLALYLVGVPGPREPTQSVFPPSPQNEQLHPPTELHSYGRLHKPSMGGIVAAEFLPGYQSRVVSIGHDGRCRLVDFTGKGEVLRTWHISNPPTCLSVIPTRPGKRARRSERSGTGDDHQGFGEAVEALIAIGTQSGNVLIFNVLGLQVHEVLLDSLIISVEWVGDMSAPCLLPRRNDMSKRVGQERIAVRYQPVQDMHMGDNGGLDENKSASDTGTVRHTKLSPSSSLSVSPVAYGAPKGLSSPASAPKGPVAHDRDRFGTVAASRGAIQHSKKRESSHPKPRIAEEPVKGPIKSLNASYSTNVCATVRAAALSKPEFKVPVRTELPKTGKRRKTAAVPAASLVPNANTSGPVKYRSNSENDEVFSTPPTSRPRSAGALRSVLSKDVQPESTRRYSFSKAEDVDWPSGSKSPGRKVAFLDVSQPSRSPFKQLKRKGSKIMSRAGIIKDRRSYPREPLGLPKGESSETLDFGGKNVQMDRLLKDNAALKSELEALRTEMQVMRDLCVARKAENVPG